MGGLNERKKRILQAVVLNFIKSAEPVGSRTIARSYRIGLSSATIRNEMADLEDMGYLSQPHTSAGRIPSQKGYRYFVDHLMDPGKLSEDEELEIIHSWASKRCARSKRLSSGSPGAFLDHQPDLLIMGPQFKKERLQAAAYFTAR